MRTYLMVCVSALFFFLSCNDNGTGFKRADPPELSIKSFTADPPEIASEDTTKAILQISFDYPDPNYQITYTLINGGRLETDCCTAEGDDASFSYFTDQSYISNSWIAPTQPGDYYIAVKVEEFHFDDKTASDTLTVIVE